MARIHLSSSLQGGSPPYRQMSQSYYSYSLNSGQPDDDAKENSVPIVMAVIGTALLVLRFLWLAQRKQAEEQDAGGGEDSARQQSTPPRNDDEAGGRVDSRAPSSTVPAVQVAPVRAAEPPPLVCTYRKADGWGETSCGVCLADMADGETLRVLPACLHYFHAACVDEWLRSHGTCPLCRAPLVVLSPATAA